MVTKNNMTNSEAKIRADLLLLKAGQLEVNSKITKVSRSLAALQEELAGIQKLQNLMFLFIKDVSSDALSMHASDNGAGQYDRP